MYFNMINLKNSDFDILFKTDADFAQSSKTEMIRCINKPTICIHKNRGSDELAETAQQISTFIFAP